jgi:two-component system KDP operon response regulator KdpE
MNGAVRVLVCDDEPQILRALKVILRDAGYEAVPAASDTASRRSAQRAWNEPEWR